MRRIASGLLLLGLLAALLPSLGTGTDCGSLPSNAWTRPGAGDSGCGAPMTLAGCVNGICAVLPAAQELPLSLPPYILAGAPLPALVNHTPSPPEPPPPEA